LTKNTKEPTLTPNAEKEDLLNSEAGTLEDNNAEVSVIENLPIIFEETTSARDKVKLYYISRCKPHLISGLCRVQLN